MDRAMIDRYLAQADALRHWAESLAPSQLDAHPVPGKWSVRQCIVHTLDSDLIATHRMRRIVAEEKPLLISYDETLFAERLAYEQTDTALACDLFALNRRFTAAWLRTLDTGSFKRTGVHNQRGLISLGEIVAIYVQHVDHHAEFVNAKRRALGKPPAAAPR